MFLRRLDLSHLLLLRDASHYAGFKMLLVNNSNLGSSMAMKKIVLHCTCLLYGSCYDSKLMVQSKVWEISGLWRYSMDLPWMIVVVIRLVGLEFFLFFLSTYIPMYYPLCILAILKLREGTRSSYSYYYQIHRTRSSYSYYYQIQYL